MTDVEWFAAGLFTGLMIGLIAFLFLWSVYDRTRSMLDDAFEMLARDPNDRPMDDPVMMHVEEG